MTRRLSWAGATLVVPALGLSGCTGAASDAPSLHSADASAAVSTAPASKPLALTGPTLSATASGSGQRQTATVLVTNPGTSRDTLFVQLVPATAGMVSPASVELAPGRSTSVHVVVATVATPVRLIEVSRSTGQTVAMLQLH